MVSAQISLEQVLAGALTVDRIANATEQMKIISEKTKNALEVIGRESPINRIRVKKYGILLNDEVGVAGEPKDTSGS